MTLTIHSTPYLETCDYKPFYDADEKITGVDPWDYESAQGTLKWSFKWWLENHERCRRERNRVRHGNKETFWKGSPNNKPKQKGLKQGWKRILEQEAFLRALAYEKATNFHDNTQVV